MHASAVDRLEVGGSKENPFIYLLHGGTGTPYQCLAALYWSPGRWGRHGVAKTHLVVQPYNKENFDDHGDERFCGGSIETQVSESTLRTTLWSSRSILLSLLPLALP